MNLHVERVGEGPAVVLLHGWGLHGGLFAPVTESLARRHAVYVPDLPGHGRSRDVCVDDLAGWVDAVCRVVPDGAVWLGWSLGGLVALRAAIRGDAGIAGLVLVATTPRFVTDDDWLHAQRPEVLEAFAAGLKDDFHRTVDDFLSLQSLGDREAKAHIRQLRASVFDHGEPDANGLASGLSILRDTDLRDEVSRLDVGTLVIAGRRDRLTPPQASEWLARTMPRARLDLWHGAAHAPFLGDPDRFADGVEEFIDGL